MAKPASLRTPGDWEALYNQVGSIIAAEPPIPQGDLRGSADILRWLGRAEALVEEVSGVVDHIRFNELRKYMLNATETNAEPQMRHIRGLLYAALAKAEMNAPTAARGAFVPAGSSFDALQAIAGVLRECAGSILVVDPYMDAVLLTDFLPLAPTGIPVRLLASGKQKVSGLIEAISRWRGQFAGERPVDLRFAAPRLLHDRLIMDETSVWSLSQSFNAIAQRSPAMVQKVGSDIASAKREAFLDMWEHASPA